VAEWDSRAQRVSSLLTNRYELIERLGQGGFASVYKVRNLRLGRIEALKVLAVTMTEEGDFSRRFEQEARFAASLDHPNIAKVYDYGGEEDLFWFSMQYIDGPTLRRQLTEGGKLDPMRAARIGLGILDALAYSHGRGIIHRDIKPDNIQLDSSRRPYLMDFGIAKSEDSAVKTQTGFIFGSPTYMSPEQIKGEALDARTDVYSLGVTLYAMLSGSLPFSADDTFRAAMKKLSEPPVPLSEKAPDVPGELEAIVMRSLARDRAERFESATEMRDALGEYLDRSRQAAAQDRTPTAPIRIPTAAAAISATTSPAGKTPVRPAGADIDATTPFPPGTITPPSLIVPEAPGGGRRIFIVLLLVAVAVGTFLIVWLSQPRHDPARAASALPRAVSPEAPRAGSGEAPIPPTALPSPAAPASVSAGEVAPSASPGPAAIPTAEPPRPTAALRATARPRATPRPLRAPPAPSPEPRVAALRPTPVQRVPGPPAEPPPGAGRAREAKYLPEPDPRYPIEVPVEIAKAHSRESVGLMVTVAEDGTVKSAKVISEVCPECDYAALQAVRKARFKPARDAEGRPVEATFAFSVRF
jgi:serine/threonine-protein kinase